MGRPGGTDMLKLHGFAQSGNTFKVAFLLRALGVPWQPVPMSFAAFAGVNKSSAAVPSISHRAIIRPPWLIREIPAGLSRLSSAAAR